MRVNRGVVIANWKLIPISSDDDVKYRRLHNFWRPLRWSQFSESYILYLLGGWLSFATSLTQPEQAPYQWVECCECLLGLYMPVMYVGDECWPLYSHSRQFSMPWVCMLSHFITLWLHIHVCHIHPGSFHQRKSLGTRLICIRPTHVVLQGMKTWAVAYKWS